MVKLSFVIVSFNTRKLLEDCISNLLGIYPNMEIIVVDNDSKDGSAQMVKDTFSDKVMLFEQENKGLASGCNLGYAASTGDYIVYIGSDAYPTAPALAELVKFMEEHKDVGICTPRLILRDGTPDMDAHRGFPTPWVSLTRFTGLGNFFPKSKLFGGYFMAYLDIKTRHEIDMCIAHFMVVRRSAQEKIGRWDEMFFLYGEDVDFCYRMKQAGFKIMYVGDVEVLHFKGGGVGRKTSRDIDNLANSKELVSKIPDYSVSAMKTFVLKHYKDNYPGWLLNFMFFAMSFLLRMRKLISKLR